jgi:hypothetical protein
MRSWRRQPLRAERGERFVPAAHAQSTIFDFGTSAEAEAIFCGPRKGYAYSRFGNPSVDALVEMRRHRGESCDLDQDLASSRPRLRHFMGATAGNNAAKS